MSEDGTENAVFNGTDALLFAAICLLIGVFSRSFLKFIPLPYTVLLLLWGIWMGVGQATYASDWAYLSEGIIAWESMSPEFLLSLFLPVLLFASAFAIEWHTFRQVMWQALLLAFPGAVIGTGLTAVCVKYLFPYDWTWSQYLMLGAMLSATVGVDKRLRIVVDGEALLNDGSAYVLFLVFMKFAAGEDLSAGDVVQLLAQLTLGGPAWGLACGIGVVIVLRFVYNDELTEVTLTIAAAFACFITGNTIFVVSGVLAIVVMGIYMSAHGALYISRPVYHSLHVVWENLEFIGNTIIFVLSGTIIADRIIESHQDNGITHIQASDYGYAVALWLLLLAIRAFIFLLLYPLLKITGYGITWKTALVMVWAGLRGAVGLVLALFTLFDPAVGSYEFRVLFFFLMGWVAALTILVQGSTTGLLLQVLGMTRTPALKKTFLQHVLRQVEDAGETHASKQSLDPLLGPPRWDVAVWQVEDYSRLTLEQALRQDNPSVVSQRVVNAVHVSTKSIMDRLAVSQLRKTVAHRFNRTVLVQEARGRFLSVLRSLFMEMYDSGNLRSHGAFRLLACVDASLDVPQHPVALWPRMRMHLASQRWLQHTMRTMQALRVPWRLTGYVVGGAVRDSVQVAAAIVQANNEAMQLMRRYDVGDLWHGAHELYYDAEMDRLLQLLRNNVMDQIAAESADDVREAQGYLGAARAAFPQLVMDVQTHHSTAGLLHHKAAFVGNLHRAGLLEDKEYDALHACVEVRMKQLDLRQPRTALADPLRVLAESTLLADVPPKSVTTLLRACSPMLVNAGEEVPLDRSSCLFVVAGSMTLCRGSAQVAVSPNTMLGGLAAAAGLESSGSCAAAAIALVVRIPAAALQALFSDNPPVEQRCWAYYGAECAATLEDSPWASLPWQRIVWLCEASKLHDAVAGQRVQCSSTSLLLKGSVCVGDVQHKAPCVLAPDNGHEAVAVDAVKVLMMSTTVPESSGILRFSAPASTPEQQSFQQARRNAQARAAAGKKTKSLKRAWRAQLPASVAEAHTEGPENDVEAKPH